MVTFITVIHMLTAVFMIFVIIIQGGNSGGVGAAFGGGNSQGVFGASGATSFLGKLTYAFAAVFMVTSISLSIMQGKGGTTGLRERLEHASSSPDAKKPSDAAGTEKAPANAAKPATNDATTTQPSNAPAASGATEAGSPSGADKAAQPAKSGDTQTK